MVAITIHAQADVAKVPGDTPSTFLMRKATAARPKPVVAPATVPSPPPPVPMPPPPAPTYTATVIGEPGQVGHWINVAMHLTGVSGGNWFNGLQIIAKGESNDNQLVKPSQPGYTCDSNCQQGTPSMGIVQTIQPTFDQFHQAGTGYNMLNPVADFSAAINYINNKYHGIDNVPGVQSVRTGGSYEGY